MWIYLTNPHETVKVLPGVTAGLGAKARQDSTQGRISKFTSPVILRSELCFKLCINHSGLHLLLLSGRLYKVTTGVPTKLCLFSCGDSSVI